MKKDSDAKLLQFFDGEMFPFPFPGQHQPACKLPHAEMVRMIVRGQMNTRKKFLVFQIQFNQPLVFDLLKAEGGFLRRA